MIAQQQKGMGLLELLLVLVIIVIFSAAIFSEFQKKKQLNQLETMNTTVKQIIGAMGKNYYNKCGKAGLFTELNKTDDILINSLIANDFLNIPSTTSYDDLPHYFGDQLKIKYQNNITNAVLTTTAETINVTAVQENQYRSYCFGDSNILPAKMPRPICSSRVVSGYYYPFMAKITMQIDASETLDHEYLLYKMGGTCLANTATENCTTKPGSGDFIIWMQMLSAPLPTSDSLLSDSMFNAKLLKQQYSVQPGSNKTFYCQG